MSKNGLGTLYVVATPIGNLEDITLRAIRILKEVDYVLCEDTRVISKLLNHLNILDKKLRTYTNHKTASYTEGIIVDLENGKSIALVSDAGTPGIADPGVFLVKETLKAFPQSSIVVSVPGPSSLAAFLSVSGLSSKEFIFYSFLPQKKGRQTILKEIQGNTKTSVFFESPHRIMKLLEWASKTLQPEQTIIIGRELTKMFEQVVSGTPVDVHTYFVNNQDKIRGEFVVGISGL